MKKIFLFTFFFLSFFTFVNPTKANNKDFLYYEQNSYNQTSWQFGTWHAVSYYATATGTLKEIWLQNSSSSLRTRKGTTTINIRTAHNNGGTLMCGVTKFKNEQGAGEWVKFDFSTKNCNLSKGGMYYINVQEPTDTVYWNFSTTDKLGSTYFYRGTSGQAYEFVYKVILQNAGECQSSSQATTTETILVPIEKNNADPPLAPILPLACVAVGTALIFKVNSLKL